jgi:hypothetical protein
MYLASYLRRYTVATAIVASAGCLAYGAGPGAQIGSAAPAKRAAGGGPSAKAARTIAFSETARLHSVSRGGNSLEEEGHATGTYDCSISVHLVIVSAERVSATFTVKPRGGTVSGSGSAKLEGEGATGYFGGSLAITKGTGIFARASGRNIGLSGTFNRETFSATVRVHGAVRI